VLINKPIFIIGSGRSGTTVFYNYLSTHPELCWISNYSDRFVDLKYIPLLHKILDLPLLGTLAKKNIITGSKKRYKIRPEEGQRIYHEYCGFKHETKTTEKDFDFIKEKKLKELIKRHCLLTGKKRFINKQTANNQRIRLINKMFDNAFYIHIMRDGRAVAYSLLNVKWWVDTDIWWLGKKVSDWNINGKPPIELCALHWMREVKEILEQKIYFEERYLEIKYEDFVKDVVGTINRVTEFCELRKSTKFVNALPKVLKNRNYKWKKGINENDRIILNNTLKTFLEKTGYKQKGE
jgi:hypothetical protein